MKIYTLPDCPNCDTLKEWLENKEIEFEVHWFDSKIHADFVMDNIFDSPPIISMEDGRILTSGSMFNDTKLDVSHLEWFLSE